MTHDMGTGRQSSFSVSSGWSDRGRLLLVNREECGWNLAVTLLDRSRRRACFTWNTQLLRSIEAEARELVAGPDAQALYATVLAGIGLEREDDEMALRECAACASKVRRHGFKGDHILELLRYVLESYERRKRKPVTVGRLVWYAFQRGQAERMVPEPWFPATPDQKWSATWIVSQLATQYSPYLRTGGVSGILRGDGVHQQRHDQRKGAV